MTAKEYKRQIKRFLYEKKYCGVVEEVVNTWNADIIGAKWNGEVNEFEIKVSLSDLRGEVRAIKRALKDDIYEEVKSQHSIWTYNKVNVDENVSSTKLEKHYHYLVRDRKRSTSFGTEDTTDSFVPNKFYFAVPEGLVEAARKLLEDVPLYGILNVDTGEFAKPARSLPRKNVRYIDMFNLFSRSCTELSQAESHRDYYQQLYEEGESIHVKRKYVWEDFRGGKHEDWI